MSATEAEFCDGGARLTYACPNCGAESFGLVVEGGEVKYARCRVCDEEVLHG